ncbi:MULTISPECIES: carbon-nitrogen hydrolase family protein [unclassified Acidovorax]|uniref:carbon-nitrogen hydrolase family protein n=1 Tax=unclassified Acidovorax TaxID=2684926 RepID=UPI001C481B09|nr:carbon-nitrogen hydrolase family protein [Acidovorax sp. sif0732]MBV7447853.1 carbon-nitrogen hydrolase family protein [Acidovorax sp. sif0715]
MNSHLSTPLRIAAAQSPSVPGDVARNVQTHLAFARVAAHHGVQVLVFPELSLTGYEPAVLAAQVLDADHGVLAPLRQAARDHGMALVVGAPAAPVAPGALLPSIGAWVLGADGSAALYRKRHLHASEASFASAGMDDAQVHLLAGEPTGLAICADITHPEHARAAHGAGAVLYAASALISEKGYGPESDLLRGYARDHGMAVLLANYSGASGGYASAGRSAVWEPGGGCVAAATHDRPCLVWAARGDSGWSGGVLDLPLPV